ncbi:MAG: hypothetical protein OJF51_002494 [Nitrospira sp.]|nr:MAG: hypothetical protein OJF51_002494 [Nitrospira sp.]
MISSRSVGWTFPLAAQDAGENRNRCNRPVCSGRQLKNPSPNVY